jgi:hypothetical protein
MTNMITESLGWVATAVFVSSYFFRRPAALRAMQMLGATLWVIYGCLIGAVPVIAANGLVFSAAAWTIAREYLSSTKRALVGAGEAARAAAP